MSINMNSENRLKHFVALIFFSTPTILTISGCVWYIYIHMIKITKSSKEGLFCYFGVFRPIWEFFTYMETSPTPMNGCKFWLMPALMAIEQWEFWGFFCVRHLLWEGTSVNNVHLRGSFKLTLKPEYLAVELLLPVLTT